MTAANGNGMGSDRKRARASAPQARMEELARLAGVSTITVSRAFHHPEKVSPATREKIGRVAEEMGYVPNLVAGGLASTRSRVVGALVPYIRDGVFADIVQGISDALEREGYQLLLGNTTSSLEVEQGLVTSLLGQRPAGLILHGGNHTRGTRNLLSRSGIPVVETGNLVQRQIDMVVGFSNFDAARAATAHLVERGYRNIGFVGSDPHTNDRGRERLRGYRAELRARGLPEVPHRQVITTYSIEMGEQALARLLEIDPDIDAVFFSSDVWAVGALLECLRRGIAVPDRLGLVGFDDQPLAGRVVPALTTVRVPRYDMGRRAAEMLIGRLKGADTSGATIDVGYEIVVREST